MRFRAIQMEEHQYDSELATTGVEARCHYASSLLEVQDRCLREGGHIFLAPAPGNGDVRTPEGC